MTDPIYGDSPLDPTEQWDETFIVPLWADPYWQAWRNVAAAMLEEANESQWLMRWRRSLVTAEGQQLIDRGLELGFAPKPAGWTDERYRDVLVAIFPGIYGTPTPAVEIGIANALIIPPQTFVAFEELPLSTRFEFTDTSADEGITYLTALDRGRPNGAQITVVSHPDAATQWTWGSSLWDSLDTFGSAVTSAVAPT